MMPADPFRTALAAEIAEAEAEAYRLAARAGIPRELIEAVLRQLAMTAEELGRFRVH
jgi:3-hydroxyisobutyrate dehydrogenase-like beta-hydroxyacid dehydrogenase